MKLNLNANKLARLLHEHAGEEVKSVLTSLQDIETLLNMNAQFKSFLQSKRISDIQKVEILRLVLKNSCHVLAIEFFGILIQERATHIIQRTVKAYSELYKEKAGLIDVQAIVVEEISEEDTKTLKNNLQRALNKKVNLKVEINNQLLGGIKLRIENTFLDASLKNKLDCLHGELLQF